MSTHKIDGLNIVLILVSLFLAFQLPFGLFLFSYAVLGPLHYLTEINWLKQKNYFVKEKKWIWVLIFLAALASALVLIKLHIFSNFIKPGRLSYQLTSNNLFNQVLLVSLIFAAALIYLKRPGQVILFLAISAIVSFVLLRYIPSHIRLLCIFLPTIIHVYLFTLLFMIAGVLYSKSKAGIVSIVLLIICPVLIFLSKINLTDYHIDALTKSTFMQSGLYDVNGYIASFGGKMSNGYSPFSSVPGIKIQIFIAFCYTYHYLNWFSKTSIIGWNKNISRPKLITITIIWTASVLLYWYNYKIGLTTLFFLSTLHVLLEFPLNITSINTIILKLRPPSVPAKASSLHEIS